jgi:GNAT superfamily N-acetyltransferase
MVVVADAARTFLLRDLDRHLPQLGALEYEPIETMRGVEHAGRLAGLALVVAPEPVPERLPTVMITAEHPAALADLLAQGGWPSRAVWMVSRADLLPQLETALGMAHDPARGARYYICTAAPMRPHPLVRRLSLADADALDLAPCSLSPTALRNWIRRGWRVYGAVYQSMLLGHALAAYPLGDTEEVAAVYTAPGARRQGFASAVVAATVADIVGRRRRAVYACKKTNLASQRVAEGLGMLPLLETWEIVTG